MYLTTIPAVRAPITVVLGRLEITIVRVVANLFVCSTTAPFVIFFSFEFCYFEGIHPAIIGGLASRETNVGYDIEATKGYGDGGNGYGMLQVNLSKLFYLIKTVF